MFRIFSLSIAGLMAIGLAQAGTIDYVTTDLATAKGSITTTGSTNSTTTITGTGASTFVDTLFSATMPAGTTPPTPSPTAQFFTNNANNPGVSSVPFVVDENTAGDTDYWSGNANNLTTTLVMDMGGYTGANASQGIFNVSTLYTLIQGISETSPVQGIVITLNGVAGDGITPISDTIDLTAGTDYRSSGTVANANGQPICTDANVGCTVATSTAVPAIPGKDTQGNNTVLTYNSAFLTNNGVNSSWLDVQELDLPALGQTGSFVGGYLDTVSIENVSGVGATKERLVLSGLTAVSTPEPASIFLLATGFGVIVMSKYRRRKQS